MNLRSFRILLPFFPNILVCWRPKFSNFLTVFTIGLSLTRFLEGHRNFGGGGFEHPNLPPRVRHCRVVALCNNLHVDAAVVLAWHVLSLSVWRVSLCTDGTRIKALLFLFHIAVKTSEIHFPRVQNS